MSSKQLAHSLELEDSLSAISGGTSSGFAVWRDLKSLASP